MPTNDDGNTRYWPLSGGGSLQIEIGEITTLPPSAETKAFFEKLFAPDRFRPAFKRGDAGAVLGAAARKGGA